jgi:renalase
MKQNIEILVVGAGLSGIMAAKTLAAYGHDVVLADKGRSAGGRMATRRINTQAGTTLLADHGAQFFTARSPQMKAWVQAWEAAGLVSVWAHGWSNEPNKPATNDGHPRYAALGGMNALAKHLAKGLDQIELNIKIATCTADDGEWLVQTDDGGITLARALVLAVPVPQALMLLDDGATALHADDREALERIRYDMCVAAMFNVQGIVNLPAPGALQRPQQKISWMADNQRKGLAADDANNTERIITLHASGPYSSQLWESSDNEIAETLQFELMLQLAPGAKITAHEVKRWRYAQPTVIHSQNHLLAQDTPPLVFSGDAFGEARVEGALLSGVAAGEALHQALLKQNKTS